MKTKIKSIKVLCSNASHYCPGIVKQIIVECTDGEYSITAVKLLNFIKGRKKPLKGHSG